MKVLVISYKYSTPEVSPTIKNIISYLLQQRIHVTLIITKLWIEKTFTIENIPIISIENNFLLKCKNVCNSFKTRLLSRISNRFLMYIENILADYKIRKITKAIDYVFCMEYPSLHHLNRVNFDLSRVIYFSLESIDFIQQFPKKNVINLLSQCKLCIIQSEERKTDFETYLSTQFNFQYLPVSIRPLPSGNHPTSTVLHKINLIYSGYFAEWACVYEIADSIINTPILSKINFIIQGHHTDTTTYYSKIKALVEAHTNITIEDRYYNDEEHVALLRSNDLAFAVYRNTTGSINWNNVLFSSGKIATYLWAGLPVITNIPSPFTEKPPFLFMKNITPDEINKVLEKFIKNPEVYKNATLEFAEHFYNMDIHMNKIMEQINLKNVTRNKAGAA